MSVTDIAKTLERSQRRFGQAPTQSKRAQRSDRGESRLHPRIRAALLDLVDGYEKPRVQDVQLALQKTCHEIGRRSPSRAAIYTFMGRAPVRSYAVAALPRHVRDTLFNLGEDAEVPGDQLVFACLNYGGTDAISFAAGLPWRHLSTALRKRGWRPKSRALLEAIIRGRQL